MRRIVNPKPHKAVEIPFLSAWDQHRLWAKIQKRQPHECWHWTGARSGFGYGRFKVAGKLHSPHRLIYALKVGKIVNVAEHHGSVVMHTCDNPACCNPAHLKLGRQIDNALDMAAKGRCGGAKHLNEPTRSPLNATLLVAVACLALGGCNRSSIEPARTGNPEVTADLIARVGGCDLYRVYDGGSRVYLSVCGAGSSRTEWTETCGKSCTRHVENLSPAVAERN